LIGAAFLCLVVFILVERRHATPLLEFRLFHERTFSAAATVYFLHSFAGMGISFAVIVFLQNVLRYSPLQVGFLLLPATLGRIVGELAAGHLSDRWGARGLSLAGLTFFSASCVALGQLHLHASVLLVGGVLVLGNTGMALSNSPVMHVGLRALRDERVSMGSGLLSLIRIIGGTFGVGAVGPLLEWADRWGHLHLRGGLPTAVVRAETLPVGYQLYFSLMAALILATLIPALLLRPTPRRVPRGQP